MNKFYLEGFVKAAKEHGLNDKQITELWKLADGAAPMALNEDPTGAGGPPPAELPPAAPIGAPGSPEHEATEAPETEQIEQLFAQLPPEAQQALLAELAQGGAAPAAGAPPEAAPAEAGAPEVAQAIHEHLNSPEGIPAGGDSPELGAMKAAEYIEGFIGRALDAGMNIKEAADTYEAALNISRDLLKSNSTEKRASHDKLSADDHYIQGMLEQAINRGLNEKEAMELVSSILNN